MAKRTSIKIDSELMQGIEAQIKEKPWFKSRTKFAEEAIKNEIKKLEDEENASIFSLIRAYYNEKQVYYAEHGIFGFEDFIKKVVLNEGVADIIKKTGQESKETNKKIEELRKEMQKDKETLILLTQLYALETTEPDTPSKKAYEEDDQMRKELRDRLKKLVTSNDLLEDLLEERFKKKTL